MKNLGKILLILPLAIIFSGCQLTGKPDGGVYKSVDGGQSFERKINIQGGSKALEDGDILSMVIDQSNPEIIYIGTKANGIFRSTNGGQEWLQDVNKFSNVNSIVIDPVSPQTLYVAVQKGARGKIIKTTNGGEKWDEVFTQAVDGPIILSLALSPSGVLYAGDSKGGIYKTEDGGVTWKNIYWAESGINKIVVDPMNRQIVYFATKNSGLLRSQNAGEEGMEKLTKEGIYNFILHPSRSGEIFLSNKNGLQKSSDAGRTWFQIKVLQKSDEIGARGLAVNPLDDRQIYFASKGAFYKSVNGGQSWTTLQFNLSRSIDIIELKPNDANVIYLGGSKGKSGVQLLPTL